LSRLSVFRLFWGKYKINYVCRLEKLKKSPLADGQRDKNTQIQDMKFFKSDIRDISKELPPDSVDVVITELYLGPLRFENRRSPVGTGGLTYIDKEIKNLSALYIGALKESRKILKANGRVVIIFLVYKIGKEAHLLPILAALGKIDWRPEPLLPSYLLKNPKINITRRQSVIYSRPGPKSLAGDNCL